MKDKLKGPMTVAMGSSVAVVIAMFALVVALTASQGTQCAYAQAGVCQSGSDVDITGQLSQAFDTNNQVTFAAAPTAARTVTIPDVSGTLVFEDNTATLTNKTLTSPDINGGTWTGTVDGSPTAAGATWTDLGSVTTADINGGTVDGATIGGAAAAAGTFTTLTATSLGGSLDAANNAINNIGAAGNDITGSAVGFSANTTVSRSQPADPVLLEVENTSSATGSALAAFGILTPSSSPGRNELYFRQGTGDGSAGNIQYFFRYDGLAGDFTFVSTDIDGASGDGDLFEISDGTDDITFNGGIRVGAPTGGFKGAGTINAVAVYDDNVLLTDYVFEPGYEMASIDEMRAYYESALHLPTIDGREVWEREGKFSVGALLNQLWETVEVQAIYIAELDARLDALESRQHQAAPNGAVVIP